VAHDEVNSEHMAGQIKW